MESAAAWLDRKNRELAFLAGWAGEPAPRAASAQELVRLKLGLRARTLARAIERHPELLETNLRPGPTRRFEGYALSYAYQRFETLVEGPAPYPRLQDDGAPALIRAERFFSSGMGALSSVLLALDGLESGPSRLLLPEDASFETLQLLRGLPRVLRVERATGGEDLLARLAADPARAVVLLDSISAEDPAAILTRLPAGRLALLLGDTSCWGQDDARILALADTAERLGVPLVLLRSHQKLDHLGLEQGRLGSAVYLTPPAAPRAAHALVRTLIERGATLSRLLGSAPIPAFLLPYAQDPTFRALNAERLATLAANNWRAAAWIAERAPEARARAFHHGCFLTLQPPAAGGLAQAALEASVERLAALAAEEGLAVRRAASFGFDFAALTAFPDAHSGRVCLRAALADQPWADCERLCELLLRWCADPLSP